MGMTRKRFTKLLMSDRMSNPRGTGKRLANEVAEIARKSSTFRSYELTFKHLKQLEALHGRVIKIFVIKNIVLFYTTSGVYGVIGTPDKMDNPHQKEK